MHLVKQVEQEFDGIEGQYDFKVVHDDGSQGSMDLRVRVLSESYMQRTLEQKGLQLDSLVAETYFYPLSDTCELRKGIGSRALTMLIDEAKSLNVKAIFINATGTDVADFFRANKFEGDYPDLYRLIT